MLLSYDQARNALTAVIAHYDLAVENLEGIEKELLQFFELEGEELEFGAAKLIQFDTFMFFGVRHFLKIYHGRIMSFSQILLT